MELQAIITYYILFGLILHFARLFFEVRGNCAVLDVSRALRRLSVIFALRNPGFTSYERLL